MNRSLISAAGVALVCFGVVAAHAVGISPAFPIAITSAHQEQSLSAAFDGTNYLVAVDGNSSHAYDVGAQLVSQSGSPVGPPIATGRTGGCPVVGFDGANYLLVWADDESWLGDTMYGCLIAPSGTPGEPFVISDRGSDLDAGGAVFDGTNYLVVWHDVNGVYGRFVSPAGSTVGPMIPLAALSPESSSGSAVAFDGARFLVVWTNHNGPNDNAIYGRFVAKSGAASDPFRIDQTPSSDANPIGIAFGRTGYLVVWNQDSSTIDTPVFPEFNVLGRIVSPSGSFLSPEFAVTAAAESASSPCFPRTAWNGTRFVVVWSNMLNGGAIRGRFVSECGTPEASAFPILQQTGHSVAFPLVYGGGKFLIGYNQGELLSGGASDVYGVFLNEDGDRASDAKKSVDGVTVALTGKVVTSFSSAPENVVYVEEPDRTSGIRVVLNAPQTVTARDVVTVYGCMTTVGGERMMNAATIEKTGSTTPLAPLGMPNKMVGGGDWFYDPLTGAGQRGATGGCGLNNVHLLVRTSGRVAAFDPAADPTWFVIDDGSGVGVTCLVASGVIDRTWTYVAVTGISRLHKAGSEYQRTLRVCRDVEVLK